MNIFKKIKKALTIKPLKKAEHKAGKAIAKTAKEAVGK